MIHGRVRGVPGTGFAGGRGGQERRTPRIGATALAREMLTMPLLLLKIKNNSNNVLIDFGIL